MMLVWMSYREVANGISRSNEDTKDQSSIGQTQNIITQILVLNMGNGEMTTVDKSLATRGKSSQLSDCPIGSLAPKAFRPYVASSMALHCFVPSLSYAWSIGNIIGSVTRRKH